MPSSQPDSDPEKQPPIPAAPARDTPPEELAHYDDAVIGKAFRWSLLAMVGIAVLGGILFLVFRNRAPEQTTRVTEQRAPETLASSTQVELPTVRFRDITGEAGIRFVHHNGAYGDKLLPETMGSGVAFLDFDNDGDQDLFFVNSTDWPGHASTGNAPPTGTLYRNNGSGTFEDATKGSGLDVSLYGMGAAVGDYDNDGLIDLFVTAVGKNHLFKNVGDGHFTDITESAGVGGAADQWSTSAAWVDMDNDGDLDLFVCNYVRWSKDIDFEVGYTVVGVGRAYGPPMNFEGSHPYLYRNEGNGRFTDVSESNGVQVSNPATGKPMAKSLGVAPVDLDQDGWMDLVVANDTVQNFVFHNRRDGTFEEIGALSGIAFDTYGKTRGAMGIDAGQINANEGIGIAIGNFANEMTALYVAQSKPLEFTDEAIAQGVGPASRLLLKFGIFFFDYDLDGMLDLLTANGHLEEELTKVQQSQHYRQPAQLFWNRGAGAGQGFVSVPEAMSGPDLVKPIVGRGSAFGDIDGDGDLDVVLTQVGGAPLLLRNDQALNHHWLRFQLTGKRNNRGAIGAVIQVQLGARTLSRQVMPTRSYLSQSELPVTIGLGTHDKVDAVRILWPGGAVQTLPNDRIHLDTVLAIEEAP
ncbi:MAG: CRTAC1 family protein [Verrucomicrobia bacterium]|nr:CRTAC1 family protein [Verrucomicrobiota bacterium]